MDETYSTFAALTGRAQQGDQEALAALPVATENYRKLLGLRR
jgi:hypothetical protein